ncbi:HNH endonuclease signature motif containing protein [Bacteroides sp.]|uniref:HNH endonuclease signature motif containing protein n=1 Tax=Bacteroides sp. TaxID=29523 RepID=UPI0025BEB073|nr:HNH endonuclease signature motif containing protein [Bacteroides sp.]
MPTIFRPKKTQKKTGDLYDAERRKIYNSERWRRLRAWKFVCNPLCEVCLSKDVITPAEDIHHIVSFMSTDDPDRRIILAYDFDNLRSLCKKCHQEVHNLK